MRYIGSKQNLLSEIRTLVQQQAPESKSICDIFAGTGSVGRAFKTTHQVLSNDLLHFCYVLNRVTVGLNRAPRFDTLSKELGRDPITFLNELDVDVRSLADADFLTEEFSPAGSARRMYLTMQNALKLDRSSQMLTAWLEQDLIDDDEFYYLKCALVEAVPFVSNIAGTYGAYLKHWDKRALNPITFKHPHTYDNGVKNKVFNADVNSLIFDVEGDVLYLDPPYNSRQYSSNYHLLETVSRYDRPQLKGKTGTRNDDAGRSDFCSRKTAGAALRNLVQNARFRHVLLSYSSEGLLTESELIEIFIEAGKPGSLKFEKIPYRRYKRAQGSEDSVTEFLIGIKK